MSEKKENYFFEFYPDSSFVEICLNKSDTTFLIKGKWELLDDKGALLLSNWNAFDFNNKLIEYAKGGTIHVGNSTLFFSSDDYQKNFKK